MNILDLPIIRLRFPEHLQDETECLVIGMDVTGDLCIQVPDDPKTSQEALKVFSRFWKGKDREKFIALIQQLFKTMMSPAKMLEEWHQFESRFEDEVKAVLSRSKGSLRQFIGNPFGCVKKQDPVHDIRVLEVVTRLASSQPLLLTRIDLNGDMSQIVSAHAVTRNDLMYCHVCGVELALSTKRAVGEFGLKLIKATLLAL